jgi:WD40 repeat protein
MFRLFFMTLVFLTFVLPTFAEEKAKPSPAEI